eukprot:scaffold58172_cov54-Phaeocystis_antarctica.AAC.2
MDGETQGRRQDDRRHKGILFARSASTAAVPACCTDCDTVRIGLPGQGFGPDRVTADAQGREASELAQLRREGRHLIRDSVSVRIRARVRVRVRARVGGRVGTSFSLTSSVCSAARPCT